MINKSIVQLLASIGIFLLLGWIFTNIYIYFLISIVISAILRPVVGFFNRLSVFQYTFPRSISVIASFIFLVSVITLFVSLFVPLISEQIRVISNLDFKVVAETLASPLSNIENFLIQNRLTSEGEGFMTASIRENLKQFVSGLDFGSILNNLISFTGSFFIGLLAVFFISFFLLYETGPIRKWFISLIPNKYFEVTIAAVSKTERLLSNYLLGLLLQMLAIFSIASLGLSILGIKYSLTIATFAAIANLIPYMGPLLGSLFGIIVGVTITPELVEFRDYLIFILKITSVFVVVQVTDNLIWQPLIFSKSVKAHPLEIFIVIFAGATLAGIVGMVLAIPVYTVVRVSFLEFYKGYKLYKIFKLQKFRFN